MPITKHFFLYIIVTWSLLILNLVKGHCWKKIATISHDTQPVSVWLNFSFRVFPSGSNKRLFAKRGQKERYCILNKNSSPLLLTKMTICKVQRSARGTLPTSVCGTVWVHKSAQIRTDLLLANPVREIPQLSRREESHSWMSTPPHATPTH